jgi:iron(III) transport system ATP-binding protein
MIRFEKVVIKYGDFVAMDDLTLEIREGEFFTFLGPSGCGKTTILRALVGFEALHSGRIYVDGEDITHVPAERRNISLVFQSYALFPTMNVRTLPLDSV